MGTKGVKETVLGLCAVFDVGTHCHKNEQSLLLLSPYLMTSLLHCVIFLLSLCVVDGIPDGGLRHTLSAQFMNCEKFSNIFLLMDSSRLAILWTRYW